jgi:tetratricopeptide (TPR) repeat protein
MRNLAKRFFWAGVMLTVILVAGCQKTAQEPTQVILMDPLAVAQGADLQRNTEVQLVEQMARYRGSYQQHLELLAEFYDKQGNHIKAVWARQELEQLQLGPQREYLVIAEVAGPDLQADRSVVEADMLYQEGMALMRQGRGGLGNLFVDKKKMYLSIDKFNELITNYPDSDKIDDAAFQIGEIYRHYLKDYSRAMLYYQRVWQWDAQTPLPARFGVAKIYDEYLHNRVKAIEYYEKAINLEAGYPQNVVYATNRIEELNAELSKEISK